ncbi:MAG: DNA-binding winged helix-turn-helix (wHTH) protein [Phenylobacterium sp.]|jgi:DNA-binding winged helix-turn-helix (wHTH) protein
MTIFRFDAFHFNDQKGTLTGPDGDTHLRPKTAQLLQYLLNQAQELVSKQALFDHL